MINRIALSFLCIELDRTRNVQGHRTLYTTDAMKLFNCIMNTEQMPSEKYIRIVQDMYRGCKTLVRSAAGESNSFGVEVGLQQCLALSPYLFLLLMDVLTADLRKDVPGSMMFADDIVLCGDDETVMTEYLETWRRAL